MHSCKYIVLFGYCMGGGIDEVINDMVCIYVDISTAKLILFLTPMSIGKGSFGPWRMLLKRKRPCGTRLRAKSTPGFEQKSWRKCTTGMARRESVWLCNILVATQLLSLYRMRVL